MSELSTDSVAVEEQPTESPASGPQMGDGFQEPDISLGDSEPAPTEQPDEGATTPAEGNETTTPAPDEGDGLRQADYTRKTQDLAERQRALEAREQTFQQERLAFQQQQTAATQAPQGPAANPTLENLRAAMAHPEATPDDRTGYAWAIEQIETSQRQQAAIDELTAWKEQAQAYFTQTDQTVQQMNQTQVTAHERQKDTEWAEAVKAFGKETVEAAVPFLDRNWGSQVDAEGNTLTVAQLVSMATGQPFQAVQAAQAENRQVRQQAKQAASTNGATHHLPQAGDGTISEAQAKAEIEATF